MKVLPYVVLCFALLFTGCAKNEKEEGAASKTSLPNFGNVELASIFRKEDNKLRNQDSIAAVIDRYYQTVWEKGDLWGGFLVAKGDNIIYENYRGFAQDGGSQPITAEVPLHVASVSKPLTAMAVLKFVEAGKIALDDPVTRFFSEFPYPKVTVLMLLTQRSGLPKYEHFIDHLTPEPAELQKKFLTNRDILNILIKYKPELARAPDTGFMYCNTNYAMLALILEKVSDMPFPQAMQQIVFAPLKMEHTYIFQEKDTTAAAKSFYQRGPKVYPYDRLDLIYGDKNVYTTPRDLLNFSKALFAKHFLQRDLYEKIFQPYSNEKPGVNNYGIGFRMKLFSPEEKLTFHNGWWHGTNSVFGHLLKSNVSIIAIGNKYSPRVYSALALSALFENFPFESEKIHKILNDTAASGASPQASQAGADAYSE